MECYSTEPQRQRSRLQRSRASRLLVVSGGVLVIVVVAVTTTNPLGQRQTTNWVPAIGLEGSAKPEEVSASLFESNSGRQYLRRSNVGRLSQQHNDHPEPPTMGRSERLAAKQDVAIHPEQQLSTSSSASIKLLGRMWHRLLARKNPEDNVRGGASTNSTTNATRTPAAVRNGTNHARGNATLTRPSNSSSAHHNTSASDPRLPSDHAPLGRNSNSTTTEEGSVNATNETIASDEGNDAGPNDALSKEDTVDSRVEHGEDEDDSGGGDGDSSSSVDKAAGSNPNGTSDASTHDTSKPATDAKANGSDSKSSSEKESDDPSVQEEELEKAEQELQAEETKIRRVSGFGAALGIFAMIFTAWQMAENPDGIYAAMCRLVLTICNLLFRLALAPCHRCCPGLLSPSVPHYRHTYGHVPATLDYGYRDPALELS